MSEEEKLELPVGRKYLLMLRDPLVLKLAEIHKQWRSNCFDEALTKEVEQLKGQVRDKWNDGIYWPETTLQGVTDYWLVTTHPYEAVKDMREDAKRKGHLIIEEIDGKLNLSFRNVSNFISCSPHEITLTINPRILTLNNAKSIKKKVWEVIKLEIEKQDNHPGNLIPSEEPEALAPILRCRQKTFENYLRWYDQWMRGLSFRRITYIELTFTDPLKREELFRKCSDAKNITVITSSMPDDLRRSITAKENAVRKGVDLIYFAIHRTKRFSDSPPEEITTTPHNGRPHKCTHDASTCLVDCPSPPDCTSYQKLLQASQSA